LLLSCNAALGSPIRAGPMPYKTKTTKPGNWSLKPEYTWSHGNTSHLRHRKPSTLKDSDTRCYDGTWPKFQTQQDVWYTPWADYLTMVYGELPSEDAFPLCMGDFWMFYEELLSKAGVVDIPEIKSDCPQNVYKWDGQRYWRNNDYDPTISRGKPGSVSWVWHPWSIDGVNNWPWYGAKKPSDGGMPDDLWVEVTHKRDPWADESYGMWFLYARGSGIWLNLGRSLRFDNHRKAVEWVGFPWTECHNFKPGDDCFVRPGDLRMAKTLRERGYDTVQYFWHHDYAQYKHCQKSYTDSKEKYDMTLMNLEIVAVGLVGEHSCGTYDDSRGALKGIGAGWYGQKWCDCSNQYNWTWCRGYGSQGDQPADWVTEDPLHYAAYPCVAEGPGTIGEEWATLVDYKEDGTRFNVGCACVAPFEAYDNTGTLSCYQNPPDYYATLAVPNIEGVYTHKKYCSQQCASNDECGTEGQWCYHALDGTTSYCVWNLLADRTCQVQSSNASNVTTSRGFFVHQASQTADILI